MSWIVVAYFIGAFAGGFGSGVWMDLYKSGAVSPLWAKLGIGTFIGAYGAAWGVAGHYQWF
jgi:hypothetical protein